MVAASRSPTLGSPRVRVRRNKPIQQLDRGLGSCVLDRIRVVDERELAGHIDPRLTGCQLPHVASCREDRLEPLGGCLVLAEGAADGVRLVEELRPVPEIEAL